MLMPDQDLVTLDVTDAGVAVVRLNRPEKHNALNQEMIQGLIEHLDEIRATPSVRAVLIEGAGKSFSAGIDLEWLRFSEDYTHGDNVDDGRLIAEMLHKLHTLAQPTIALVNGAAIGAALGLIAACDVAVAVKWAEFRFAEVRLGLTPASVAPYVVKSIGPRWARALFVTGKAFDAGFAREIGLVQYVVPDVVALTQQAEDLTALIFHAAPGAIGAAKKLVDDVMWRELGSLRHMTADRFAQARESEEGREGVAAFLEKRKPSWAE
jgi:methylglutaconyl-CoA hydratase